MTRWVVLASTRPNLPPTAVEAWVAGFCDLSSQCDRVVDADAGRALTGSVADADICADVRTADDEHGPARLDRLPAVADLLGSQSFSHVETLALQVLSSRRVEGTGPRVKRTLALTVREGTDESDIVRLERSLVAMPDHISEIRSWSLSRVDRARSSGPWTHVWEQEYADVDGVRVAYLQHPYHWTGVDRWFDPEMPCAIVEPGLAHLFRWVDRPIIDAAH